MPSASDVKRAFSLTEGSALNAGQQFITIKSSVGHEVKKENERYEFPTQMTVEWQGSGTTRAKELEQRKKRLLAAFKRHISKPRIVHSAYGSPYECSFSAPKVTSRDKEGRRWELTALGRAVRRRDIPTRAEEKASERGAGGKDSLEVSPEDKAKYLQGYRVIMSRFGTSECPACGNTIDPGVKIARPEGQREKGGWVHAACVARQRKAEEAGKGRKRGKGADGTAGGAQGGKRPRPGSAASKLQKRSGGSGEAAEQPGSKKRRRSSEE